MIKIVYFDDRSVTDYLNIYNGGEKIQTVEQIEEKTKAIAGKTTVDVFAKLSWLPFFGGSAQAEVDAELSKGSSSLINTTLSNTVLTEFLEVVDEDTRIEKFTGYSVQPYKNSLAHIKMFTPYMTMGRSDIKVDEDFVMDISKADEAFSKAKGYYELIASSNETCISFIMRFNIEAFRNNYGIADLTKMELKYYGIKVGRVDEKMLDMNKEFSMDEEEFSSGFDLIEKKNKENMLDVYDIILAGVEA